MSRLADPRGRPFKIFTVIYEQFDRLHLLTVRAHDAEHAKVLARRQLTRSDPNEVKIWVGIRMVLAGTAKVAT